MKRIAVDLAKSVYQVAESVRAGEVIQRKRLNRGAFSRYVQEQVEPVEWVMDPWLPRCLIGCPALSEQYAGAYDRVAALGKRNGRAYWSEQSSGGAGEQAGKDLLGRVVLRAALQR